MATEPTILKPQQPSTSTALAQSGETSAVVLAEAAKAEILARYYLARENPRDFDEVREAPALCIIGPLQRSARNEEERGNRQVGEEIY